MKFGVREICDVTFKALQSGYLGSMPVQPGQPVLYIDSAKTSTIEGAATTVYAQGGKGNARLVAWEGEKTLTFTVEDALLSPIGFAILSGAGLYDINKLKQTAMVHCTAVTTLDASLAPVLEGTASIPDIEYEYESEIYNFVSKYFNLNLFFSPPIITLKKNRMQ